jgi:toxin ParE1/3/4
LEEKFRFDDGAQKDINEAFEWHELQSTGRGDKFLESLKLKLKQIEKKPEAISADKNGVRKRSLKGFPYFIFYTIASPFILIIAVWHFSRDRFGWKNRLKKD